MSLSYTMAHPRALYGKVPLQGELWYNLKSPKPSVRRVITGPWCYQELIESVGEWTLQGEVRSWVGMPSKGKSGVSFSCSPALEQS